MTAKKPLLHVVHKEVLSPKKFLVRLAEQPKNIARARIRAPKIGQNGFGKIVVSYKNPILERVKP